MALTVAELAFVFGADVRQVDQGYDHVKAGARSTAKAMDSSMTGFWRDEASRTRRAADDYQRAGKQSGEKFKAGFASSTKNIAAGLAASFGALEVVRFFGDSIEAASHLNETANKTKVIFGESATAIEAWSKDSSKNILLTQQQALDAAAMFGVFGKAAGKTGEDLASFSLDLTSLAQDFSSFFDARPEDAILAIGSALRGENEPIRQFGVLLDDATLRARALKMGLIATTKDALTPQQKALAAYNEILAQTHDAQGDAARTQAGFANSSRALAQQVEKLKVKIGDELLPAATGFVHFMTDTGVPALGAMADGVSGLVHWFDGLPAPIKGAAAALALLKVASAFGWTDTAAAGIKSVGSAVDGLRLRVMMAVDEYRASRTGILEFNGNVGKVVTPATRATSALQALKTAGVGAGAGLKAGLGGVVGFLGGPWGIALTAATAAITYFWQENKKAKQFVDDLTASLDKQTGKLTETSSDIIRNKLFDSGAVDAAKELGINLRDLQLAAEGNASSMIDVTNRLRDFADVSHSMLGGRNVPDPFHFHDMFGDDKQEAANKIRDALGDVGQALDMSTTNAHDLAEMTGEVDKTTGAAASTMKLYGQRTAEAADAVRDLWEAENKQRLAAVQAKRDQLALIETTKAAHQEAREGKKTLDEETKAGRDNWAALLDLADQWNNSKASVRNAKGAYGDMRQEFIEIATVMSGNADKAKRLAERLLTIPKHVPIRFQTDEMKAAIREAERLRALLNMGQPIRIGGGSMVGTNNHAAEAYADGGEVRGIGGPRDDRVWARVSPGEWVTPNGPSQKYRRSLQAIRNDDPGALRASIGGGINHQELAAAFAQMVGGRIAPAMHVDNLNVETLRDTKRHMAQEQTFAAVGGERGWV